MDLFDELTNALKTVILTKSMDGLNRELDGEILRNCFITFMLVCMEHSNLAMFIKVCHHFSSEITSESYKRLLTYSTQRDSYVEFLKYLLSPSDPFMRKLLEGVEAEHWFTLMTDCIRDKRWTVLRHVTRYYKIDFEHRAVFWYNRLQPFLDHGPALDTSRIRLLHEYKFSSETGKLEGESFKLQLMRQNLWDVERTEVFVHMHSNVIAPWTGPLLFPCCRNKVEDELAYDIKSNVNTYLFQIKQKIHFLRDCANRVCVKTLIMQHARAPDTTHLATKYMVQCLKTCANYDTTARLLLPGAYRDDVTDEYVEDLPLKYEREAVIEYLTSGRSIKIDKVMEDFLWHGFGLLYGARAVELRSLQSACLLKIYASVAQDNKTRREIKSGVARLPLPSYMQERLMPVLTGKAILRKRNYVFKTFNSAEEAFTFGNGCKADEYSQDI